MATERFTDAAQFSRALRFRVPKTIRDKAGVVYFDATTQLHEQIVSETPVRTGYLRAGLVASAPGLAALPAPSEASRAHATDGAYTAHANAAAVQVGLTLAQAARGLLPIVVGFVASYAPYVEDRVHMMKRARARWRGFVAAAVGRAKEAKEVGVA